MAPNARLTPISVRRSNTEITITLAIPMPPTSRATAPNPSSRPVNAASLISLAAIRSLGRLTTTSLEFCGRAVDAMTART